MADESNDMTLGEDLFDFDELMRELPESDEDELAAAFDAVSEVTASAGEPAPQLRHDDEDLFAADALLFETQPKAPLPAPTHRVRPTPPPLGSVARAPAERAPLPVRPVEPAPATPAAPAVTATTTVLQRLSFSPALAVVLLLITVLNLGLVAFVVRALTSVQSTVVDVGQRVISSAESVRDEASTLAADHAADALPVVSVRPEGLSALERARTQFAGGAYEGGRQTLFGLLAVIDRVPPEVRVDVEARARFLIADSWRLEADALARHGGRPQEDPQ